MPHSRSGAALGTELMKMLEAADAADRMADAYLAANGEVSGTVENSVKAFSTQSSGHPAAEVHGPSLSSAGAAWTWLRDAFQGILGENYINLRETARALRLVVAEYSSTDEAAADKLRGIYDGHIPEASDWHDGYDDPDIPPHYAATTREEDEATRREEEQAGAGG